MATKYGMLKNRLQSLRANFREPEREKRAIAVVGAVFVGTLLAVTGIVLYAELKSNVNALEKEIAKIENLELTLDDVINTK